MYFDNKYISQLFEEKYDENEYNLPFLFDEK